MFQGFNNPEIIKVWPRKC